MDYPRLLKVADFSYFYILFTDWQTDGHWYLLSCYRDWKEYSFIIYQRLTNSEDLNIDEESWIGSLASIGALAGTIVSQVLNRYISARHGLIVSAAGSFLGWGLIFSAAQENFVFKQETRLKLDDAIWLLMMLDDAWWCYMTLDDAWWWLMMLDFWCLELFWTNRWTNGQTNNTNSRVALQLKNSLKI